MSFLIRRRLMISKPKLGAKLGALAFIAAIAAPGFASPSFAANYGGANLGPGQSGGGSYGYNSKLSTDYRLKHHQAKHPSQANQPKQ
jgi:hypothetical protein